MENNHPHEGQDPNPNDPSKEPITNQEAFENPSTDPGFEPSFLEEETPKEEREESDTHVPLEDEDDEENII
jgi:hypothetical protein